MENLELVPTETLLDELERRFELMFFVGNNSRSEGLNTNRRVKGETLRVIGLITLVSTDLLIELSTQGVPGGED